MGVGFWLLVWRLRLEVCGEVWDIAHGVSSRAQVPGRACAGAALLSAGASMAQSAVMTASGCGFKSYGEFWAGFSNLLENPQRTSLCEDPGAYAPRLAGRTL